MKTKFILHLSGAEGCEDYRVGCGTKIIELNAQVFEAARVEAEARLVDESPDAIDEARIISVVDITSLDLTEFHKGRE